MGYGHPGYAASLAEFGRPRQLPGCDGWLLERSIPGSNRTDLMGPYPLFSCADWSKLPGDLEALEGRGTVSLSLVTDSFGEYDEALLQRAFPDRVMPFKRHFLVHLPQSLGEISKHHRYYARQALNAVSVMEAVNPLDYLDEWVTLYDHLIQRHGLSGVKAFSRSSFAKLLSLPGLVMLRALDETGHVVAAHLWLQDGETATSHLLAMSPAGYGVNASYALYWSAVERFRGRAEVLNIGAGAGIDPAGTDGLTRFKRGWANDSRLVYFCGRVLDEQAYRQLEGATGTQGSAYFPSYRSGELV
jgi:hypothetical protein